MKHLGSSLLRESLSHISYARRQAQRRVRHASGLPILSAPRFNADLVRAHNYITRSPRGVKGELGELGQLLKTFQTADSRRGVPFASGPSRSPASSAHESAFSPVALSASGALGLFPFTPPAFESLKALARSREVPAPIGY